MQLFAMLRTMPEDDSIRPFLLRCISAKGLFRYSRTGSLADLDDAIKKTTDLLELSMDPPDRMPILEILGTLLRERYKRTTSSQDLTKLISTFEELSQLPADPSNRASNLSSLAFVLYERYHTSKSLHDLNRAIATISRSVHSTPREDDKYANRFYGLCFMYSIKARHTKSPEDVDQTTIAIDKALEVLPPDHPLALELLQLGSSLLRDCFLLAISKSDAGITPAPEMAMKSELAKADLYSNSQLRDNLLKSPESRLHDSSLRVNSYQNLFVSSTCLLTKTIRFRFVATSHITIIQDKREKPEWTGYNSPCYSPV